MQRDALSLFAGVLLFLTAQASPVVAAELRQPVPGQFVVFDQRFTRESGAPKTIETPFRVLDPNTTYTIYAQPAGAAPPGVSSAVVGLNQQEIFSQKDFKGSSDQELARGVTVGAENVVRVTMQGKPGETLRVLILGDDPTPPTIRETYTPALTPTGWSLADLTIGWICEDPPPVSGIASCGPQPVTITAEGITPVTGTAVNNAALSKSITVAARVDKHGPEITVETPGTASTDRITVAGSVADPISGLARLTCNEVPMDPSSGRFACEALLVPGRNRIVVRSWDVAGNVTRTDHFVEADYTPTVDPEVAELVAALPSAKVRSIGLGGVPQFLGGNLGTFSDPDSALATVAPLLHLTPGELVFEELRTAPDGVRHAYFRQTKNGLDVTGGHLLLHLSESGRLVAANGSAYGGPPIPAMPFITAEEARTAAIAAVPGMAGEPRLCYRIATSDRRMALVYEARVQGEDGFSYVLYIHAHDGELFELQPEMAAAAPVHVYAMQPEDFELPGTFVRGPATGSSSDAVAEANYQLLVAVEAFFYQLFGLNSYNGSGATITSTVHNVAEDFAAWDPDRNQFVFGDGEVEYEQTATDPDIAAHEYQHAVNQYSSGLQRTGEPGGLGEAFGDAAAASFDAQQNGLRSSTWKIAEEVYRLGEALRHMDDPLLGSSNPDQSPWDYYPEFRSWYSPGCDPFTPGCNAHDIAGIGDLWFYLLSESPTGLHPRGKSEVYVPRAGFLEAFRILQHANRFCLFSNARFEDARWCTAEAARYSSTEDRSVPVQLAWDAVGAEGSPNTSQVEVRKLDAGNGAVFESRYRRIDCAGGLDARCEAMFAPGERVTLKAVPDMGYRVRWEGPCNGFGDCTFDVQDQGLTIVAANFERLTDAVVIVTKSGDGLGTVTGPGINCGTTCGAQMTPGTTITLNAAVGPGSLFRSWTGPCTHNGPTCTFQVSMDLEVGATFDRMLGCVPPFCFTFTATVTGSVMQRCTRRTETVEQWLTEGSVWRDLRPLSFTDLHRLDLDASGSTSETARIDIRKLFEWKQCRWEEVWDPEAKQYVQVYVCSQFDLPPQSYPSAGCTIQAGTGACKDSRELLLSDCRTELPTEHSSGEVGGNCPAGYSCTLTCKGYQWYLDPAGFTRATLTRLHDDFPEGPVAGQPYEVRGEFDVSRDSLNLGGFHVSFSPDTNCSLIGDERYFVASNTRHVDVKFSSNKSTMTFNAHDQIIAELGYCDSVDALSIGQIDVPYTGGGGSFAVTSSQVCRWTSEPSDSWIRILQGGPRLGNGTVVFDASENPFEAERTGVIRVADKTMHVRQAPRPPFRGPALIPVHVDAPAGDNHITIRVGKLNGDGSANWSNHETIAPPGHVGHVTKGADIACADLDGDGEKDCVILHVDGPNIGNLAYLRIGYRMNADGVATRGWTDVKPVGGGPLPYGPQFGNNQDAGLALGDVDRNGALDAVVFWVHRRPRTLAPGVVEFFNVGVYRIGWNLNAAGDVTGGWTQDKTVGDLSSLMIEGVGVTLADVDRDGLLDLIPLYTRSGQGTGGSGFYLIGYGLNSAGDVSLWSSPRQVGGNGGWFGDVNDGAGIAAGDVNRNGTPDLVVFHIDDPAGENGGWYRVGWDVDANGNPAGWTDVFRVPGWFGDRDEGAGIAFLVF